MRVTHRFHPQSGPDLDFVAHRRNGVRIGSICTTRTAGCLPGGGPRSAPADPCVVIAEGCCPFTVDDLLALADLIGPLRSRTRVRQEPSATGQQAHPGRGRSGAGDIVLGTLQALVDLHLDRVDEDHRLHEASRGQLYRSARPSMTRSVIVVMAFLGTSGHHGPGERARGGGLPAASQRA